MVCTGEAPERPTRRPSPVLCHFEGGSCNALPRCLGAVGSGTPAMHCLTASGQWAVELLQCTASLPGGSGQRNSSYALPHCLGAGALAPWRWGGPQRVWPKMIATSCWSICVCSTFGLCNLTGCECRESAQKQPWDQVNPRFDNIGPPQGECVNGVGMFYIRLRHRAGQFEPYMAGNNLLGGVGGAWVRSHNTQTTTDPTATVYLSRGTSAAMLGTQNTTNKIRGVT